MGALEAITSEIARAAIAAGRDPASVGLIAVSKRHPVGQITSFRAQGQVHFGENLGQELRDKSAQLDDATIKWHFIGRIQKNKARYVAPVAYRVHALEEVRHAEALAARATAELSCLMAVNIGREPQKSGVLPEQVLSRLAALDAVPGIRLRGLMCIPPFCDDPEDVGVFYEEMADLQARACAFGFPLTELSMGMSRDFAVAIRYGATWVRIGTALFGPRS